MLSLGLKEFAAAIKLQGSSLAVAQIQIIATLRAPFAAEG